MEAFGELFAFSLAWLLDRFRNWLDGLPDRDPSVLPLWHRLARVALALAVCLAFLALYVWIALRIQGCS